MKKLNLEFLLLIIFVSCSIASAALVAQWDFNGNANDGSGNGNNGSVYGATLTTDRFGNPDKAYFFDGTGDYIDVPNAATLRPSDAITITAWFKADSFALGSYSWPPIVDKTSTDLDGYGMAIQQVYENNPCVGFGVGLEEQGFRGIPVGVGAPKLTQGTWYFAAGVYNGTVFRTYVGTSELPPLFDTSEMVSGNIVPSYNNLNIGRNTSHTDRLFEGVIDDVRIYDSALSSDEIYQLYYAIPEPATLLLLGLGGLMLRKRRI